MPATMKTNSRMTAEFLWVSWNTEAGEVRPSKTPSSASSPQGCSG